MWLNWAFGEGSGFTGSVLSRTSASGYVCQRDFFSRGGAESAEGGEMKDEG